MATDAKSEYSQSYAFTLTLKPERYKDTSERQLCTTSSICHELKNMGNYSLCYELTLNMNIHYHGIIEFHYDVLNGKTPANFWYNYFRRHRFIGYTHMKIMTDEEGWKRYIVKNVHSTSEHLPSSFFRNPLKDNHNLQLLIDLDAVRVSE